MDQDAKGKKIAVKKSVSVGETYGDKAQISAGLDNRAVLITEGYQSLYDRQEVRTE
jgi:hypothetical protein